MLEMLHPSQEGTNPDFATGAAFLDTRFLLGQGASFVMEFPYARFEGSISDLGHPYEASSHTPGNPYLGFEFHPPGHAFFTELGARVPFADRDELVAAITGAYADMTRFDAFSPYDVPVHVLFNFRQVSSQALVTRLRLGTVLAFPRKRYDDNVNVSAVFAWEIGYEGGFVRVGSAISGTSWLSGNDGNVGERTMSQLELHGDVGSSVVRPGLEVNVPFGDRADRVPIVLGASIAASF